MSETMEPPSTKPSNQRGKASGKNTFVRKHRVRAIFRSASFLALVVGFSFMNYVTNDESHNYHRRLDEEQINQKGIFQRYADPLWLLAVYIFGVLYMFLALAIVCDEYFVPALEVMSGEFHLNLTPDISGATLMAAGGSAPELFTSFIGTFQESEVGFGTIVGSAVFNVLFVIGMCSLLSKETLELTWWPLFRDSIYYAIGLLVLAIFVGVKGPGEVDLVEAIVLVLMYFGYILVMGLNERLYKMITKKDLYPETDAIDSKKIQSTRVTTFRSGLLTLIYRPGDWISKARISFVSKIAGNVDDVFDYVDGNGDGLITKHELKTCFLELERVTSNDEINIHENELNGIMKEIDDNNDGKISKKEFKAWYLKSEEHIKVQIKNIFDKYDTDGSGGIDRLELKELLMEVEPNVMASEIEHAVQELFKEGPNSVLSFDAFSDWYFRSTWYKQHTRVIEEDEGKTFCEAITPPKGTGCFGLLKFVFLLPIVLLLALTIPDVRRPELKRGYWCYLAFIISICWIGIYSYFMVGWAEIIGETLGIDTFIMGLTFLAAGTSVPDLLSSVIVARMGEGDMAVSSSIGSNIFDILVGLPVPWLVYTLWPTKPKTVTIGAEGVWISIMILLAMLVLIIISIHLSGWKLTKKLGFTMFFLYFCFLAQAIARYVLGI